MDRLLEPSTWAGLAALLGNVAALLPEGPREIVIGFAGAFGGVAVILREKGAA